MGLVLQNVQQAKSGWQRRRRVPKAVAGTIPKLEFKRVLWATKAGALARYPTSPGGARDSGGAAEHGPDGWGPFPQRPGKRSLCGGAAVA